MFCFSKICENFKIIIQIIVVLQQSFLQAQITLQHYIVTLNIAFCN